MSLEWEQVIIDAVDPEALGAWWAEALGWVVLSTDPDECEIRSHPDRTPGLLFVPIREGKTVKNRLHLDFRPDDREAEVSRLEALGATRIDIGQGEQTWVVMADPEGNEFCVLRPASRPAVSIVPPDVMSGPRLDLVLVTVEQLLSREDGKSPVPLAFDDPDDVLNPDSSPLLFRIAQVREDPSVNPWLIRLAVLREAPQIIGIGNFHNRPDDRGMVEIGYSVLPRYRGQGYATEIAMTMWKYATALPDVQILRATVGPDNEASLRIVRGAGFVHVSEQDDPEDGLELIYELDAADFRSSR